jgi:hypothetical protein
MDLARIVLIAAVCLVDGILLLWDWRRMGSPIDPNRWTGGGDMCRTPGCARP